MVPHFVTSNSFIARAYSNVIAGIIRDQFDVAARVPSAEATTGSAASTPIGAVSPRGNRAAPIYIIEVGAGHGRLGFLVINALMAMR